MAGIQQFVGSWEETTKEGFEEMASALGKQKKLWVLFHYYDHYSQAILRPGY